VVAASVALALPRAATSRTAAVAPATAGDVFL